MHSTAFCLRKASPDKRTGKKSKLEFGRGNKNKAGKRQQELDGRNLSCPLGTRTLGQNPSNGDTPISMDLRKEAVNPAEIGKTTVRTEKL
ncbi:hypothetical protein Tco_0015563 [Tanacetum coccineum]